TFVTSASLPGRGVRPCIDGHFAPGGLGDDLTVEPARDPRAGRPHGDLVLLDTPPCDFATAGGKFHSRDLVFVEISPKRRSVCSHTPRGITEGIAPSRGPIGRST